MHEDHNGVLVGLRGRRRGGQGGGQQRQREQWLIPGGAISTSLARRAAQRRPHGRVLAEVDRPAVVRARLPEPPRPGEEMCSQRPVGLIRGDRISGNVGQRVEPACAPLASPSAAACPTRARMAAVIAVNPA